MVSWTHTSLPLHTNSILIASAIFAHHCNQYTDRQTNETMLRTYQHL